jgi:hypothetical protein
MPNSHPTVEKPTPFWRSRGGIVLGMLLVIAVFFVVNEHLAHAGQALSYLPYLILLACPLMHIFGHHHGGHNHSGHKQPEADPDKDDQRS